MYLFDDRRLLVCNLLIAPDKFLIEEPQRGAIAQTVRRLLRDQPVIGDERRSFVISRNREINGVAFVLRAVMELLEQNGLIQLQNIAESNIVFV